MEGLGSCIAVTHHPPRSPSSHPVRRSALRVLWAEPVAAISTAGTEQAVERLRELIGDKQEETVEILRSWLEESEEEA